MIAPLLAQPAAAGSPVVTAKGSQALVTAASYPAAAALATGTTKLFLEPIGSYTASFTDVQGKWYVDNNFSNMCTDGSGAILMYYWSGTHSGQTYPNVTIAGSYAEPYSSADWTTLKASGSYPTFQNANKTTYWNYQQSSSVYGRGYMVYLSMQIDPITSTGAHAFPYKGLDDYHSRSTGAPQYQHGADPDYTADALNWETASHQQQLWKGYFWVFHYKSDSSLAANLNNAVMADISAGQGVQARVRAGDLPNWPSTEKPNIGHAVTIVGYDNTAKTYSYIDTYNPHKGLRTISQSQMVTAMLDMPASSPGSPADGGYIW